MRWDVETARSQFVLARVARLATVSADGRPHVVPIVFAVSDTDVLYFAVDGKPKSTTALKRLDNIAANPDVSLLVDHYDDDWTRLWWVRADGSARLVDDAVETADAIELLALLYAQYADSAPLGPVVAVDVRRWSGWTAAESSGSPTW